MNKVKLMQIIIFICSELMAIYILFSLFYQKKKFKQKKISRIKNNKYIILIFIIIMLFFVSGILRNIE